MRSNKQWYTVTYALQHGWLWFLVGVCVFICVTVSLSLGYVRTTTPEGVPLFWPRKQATLNMRLGGTIWNNAAREAAAAWNQAGSLFRFDFEAPAIPAQQSCVEPDFLNTVLWSAQNCGLAFGDFLAFTAGWTLDDGTIGDLDVLFNTAHQWDVYAGALRFSGGAPVFDLRRVAIHEFGHVLGLSHPDDHGQQVRALMNSDGGSVERPQPDDIAGVRAIYGATRVAPRGTLGNPGHETFASGIGVISGWVCDAQRVEVQIGLQRIRMAYGTERLDTQSVCGDTNNGFVTLVNYNSLGTGIHTARLVVDGQQVGRAHEFSVMTFGTEFLRGAEGVVVAIDFPRPGVNPVLIWDQGRQNFVIASCESEGELVRCDTLP